MATLETILGTENPFTKDKFEEFIIKVISKEGVELTGYTSSSGLTLNEAQLKKIQSAIKELFEGIETNYELSRGEIYNNVFNETSTKIKLKEGKEIKTIFEKDELKELNTYLKNNKFIRGKSKVIDSKAALGRMLTHAYDTDIISEITPVTDPILEKINKVSEAYTKFNETIEEQEALLTQAENELTNSVYSLFNETNKIGRIEDRIGVTESEKDLMEYYTDLSTKIVKMTSDVKTAYQSRISRYNIYKKNNDELTEKIKTIRGLLKTRGLVAPVSTP